MNSSIEAIYWVLRKESMRGVNIRQRIQRDSATTVTMESKQLEGIDKERTKRIRMQPWTAWISHRLDVMDSVGLNSLDTALQEILPCTVVMVKKPLGMRLTRRRSSSGVWTFPPGSAWRRNMCKHSIGGIMRLDQLRAVVFEAKRRIFREKKEKKEERTPALSGSYPCKGA